MQLRNFLKLMLSSSVVATAMAVAPANAVAFVATPGVTLQSGWTFGGCNCSGMFGFAFTPVQDVMATALGFFDSGQDGLVGFHDLYLADANEAILSSATVSPGTSDLLINQYRYASIAPVRLIAGQQYIVAGLSKGQGANDYVGQLAASNQQFNGITFLHATQDFRDWGDTTTFLYSANLLLEPAPTISPVPEPATWAMMIAGFGMIGGTMRRRVRTATVRFA